MKIFLIIPFFFCKPLFSQCYARWITKPLEQGISSYSLQDSSAGYKWETIENIQPTKFADTNYYKSSSIHNGYYYRVVANYIDKSEEISHVIYLSPNNVSITNTKYIRQLWLDVINWKVSNSNNIYLYRIDETTDGKKYNLVVNYKNNGDNNYKFSIYRIKGIKPTYRITPVFTDLSLGQSIIFK